MLQDGFLAYIYVRYYNLTCNLANFQFIPMESFQLRQFPEFCNPAQHKEHLSSSPCLV